MLLVHHARTALITQAAEAADLGPDRAPRPPNRRRYGGLSPEDWNNALPHVLASITAKINSARRYRSCLRAVKRPSAVRRESMRSRTPGRLRPGSH
jgi:hypothetical protein